MTRKRKKQIRESMRVWIDTCQDLFVLLEDCNEVAMSNEDWGYYEKKLNEIFKLLQ